MSPSAHGNFYELYAIAAAVLGGCSLRGGEGSIIGIVLGTVLLQVLQNLVNMLGIPSSLNFAVMGAVILLGSGFYQYSRGWQVAPVTWIGGSLMLAAVYYGTQINPGRDLLGITLLVFAAVIAFGLVTGEG